MIRRRRRRRRTERTRLETEGGPLCQPGAPGGEVRAALGRVDPQDAGEIDRDGGGDIGHAEPAGGHIVAGGQMGIEAIEEIQQPRPPAFGELRDLGIVDRAGQRAVLHRGGGIAHRLGNGHEAFGLDLRVPAGDLRLVERGGAQQRRLRLHRFGPGEDRGVVGQGRHALRHHQRGDGAGRVDGAKALAQLLTRGQVDDHGVMGNPLFRQHDPRAARAGGAGVVIENRHWHLPFCAA